MTGEMSTLEVLTAPEFYGLQAAFFLLIGACLGSFFNVCIYRIPAGQPLLFPGSHCYHCGKAIKAWDNIPVLSYFLLNGRCRNCAAPFSMRYAAIEALTALLFLALFQQFGFQWPLWTYLTLTGLLLIAAFTDIDHWIIPDRISLGGTLIGWLFALGLALLPGSDGVLAETGPFYGGPFAPFWNSLFGAVVGAGVIWLVGFLGSLAFRKDSMGFGDVKLLLLIGAFTGWKIALLTLFLGALIGSVYGIGAILFSRFKEKGKVTDSPPEYGEVQKWLDGETVNPLPEKVKNVLARLLMAHPPTTGGPGSHHLPFGPHLALAAWLLLWQYPAVLAWLERYYF